MTAPLTSAPVSTRDGYAACFSADVEQDCPPYLQTCRGMTEGLPRLLDLLAELSVRGTFFTTGEMARRYPDVVRRIVDEGHELGCHGDTHPDFSRLSRNAADTELRESLATLRTFGPVVSFRAPYLRFPAAFLPLLVQHGLRIDSSAARYKFGADHSPTAPIAGLVRVPASVTSSVLRLPAWIRSVYLRLLAPPAMLFVHPWEAADFRASHLRWDCRFRTGAAALHAWRHVIVALQRNGARFQPLNEIAAAR